MATAAVTDPREDPLDPRRIVVDMVELLSHEVLDNSKDRSKTAKQLNYFLLRLGGVEPFGRLYSRLMAAWLVEKFCGRDAYRRKTWPTEDGGQDQTHEDKSGHVTPLVECTSEQWESFIKDLNDIKAAYIRMDANTLVVPQKIEEYPNEPKDDSDDGSDDSSDDVGKSRINNLEDASINEELASSELFQNKYDELYINLRFHQALSIFRAELERELDQADEVNIETPGIQPGRLVEFNKFLSSHFESTNTTGARSVLESLLVRGKGGDHKTRSGGLALKSIGELKRTFSRKEFSLDRLQRKVERTLRKWSEAVLEKPALVALGYGTSKPVLPPVAEDAFPAGDEEQLPEAKRPRVEEEEEEEEEEEAADTPEIRQQRKEKSKRGKKKEKENEDPTKVSAEVQELARARQTLRDDVDDPLEESRAIAATAARAPAAAASSQRSPRDDAKPSAKKARQGKQGADFYKKKKSAQNLIFTDSEDESDDDDEGGTTLSEVPRRPDMRAATQEKPSSRRVEHNQSPAYHAKKRKRFTDEEQAAIKLGVERFGFGRWAKIKEYYKEELRNRTPGNIKDKYRTMMSNNEV